MATFVWIGRNRQGGIQKGELVGKSREDVARTLRKQNILATSIQRKLSAMEIEIPGMGQKVTPKDVVIFTRQFSTMIDAGLPLVQCLEILADQSENKTLSKVINDVRMDVEAGATYADSLRKHPKVFDDLYVNMVAAGEAGGILDVIQRRLATHMEKSIKLKKKIKGAMVYPSSIVGIATVVMIVLMVFVIPVFAKMFTDTGGELPGPTLLVLNASDFVVDNIWFLLGGAVGSFFGVRALYKTPVGRREMDRLALRLPVFGDLIRKASVAKFTRTLGTLISSGVPILEGLSIVAATAGNKIVEQAINHARSSISEGKNVAEPLAESKVFPPMVVQMIGVGEATGAMDTMLSKIADFYDDEVDDSVAALTSMLEPMLMVFLGVTIGFIVIAMYLPIFEMASVVG
ncbi:MAG: type II secretion system F family protein [Nitrospirae bacterium]|nr:type II secretion system F family protein [Nitrospirota bacterium]